jgi:hypothetical protein
VIQFCGCAEHLHPCNMNDDDRDFPRDPASLLPFVCELMPVDPDAVQIANSKKYIGEKATDGDA